MAYISLALFVLAVLTLHTEVFAALCVMVSFVCARALFIDSRLEDLGGHRWFAYPGLFAVYIPCGVVLLGWPLVAGVFAAHELGHTVRTVEAGRAVSRFDAEVLATCLMLPLTALVWSIYALIAGRWPEVMRSVLYPFAANLMPKPFLRLAVGLFVLAILLAVAGSVLATATMR